MVWLLSTISCKAPIPHLLRYNFRRQRELACLRSFTSCRINHFAPPSQANSVRGGIEQKRHAIDANAFVIRCPRNGSRRVEIFKRANCATKGRHVSILRTSPVVTLMTHKTNNYRSSCGKRVCPVVVSISHPAQHDVRVAANNSVTPTVQITHRVRRTEH